MATRIGAHDWAATPFGPPERWPEALTTALGICLHSTLPTAIYWGPDLRLLYNDAWSPIPGDRHPAALGRPAAEVWNDIWPVVGPQFAEVMRERRGISSYDQLLSFKRYGVVEETYWNYSFTPILGPDGEALGVFNQGNETTERVLRTRAQTVLLEMNDLLGALDGDESASRSALEKAFEALARHARVARAGYAVIDGATGSCTVVANFHEDRVADLTGRLFPLEALGGVTIAELLFGNAVASDNTAIDPRQSARADDTFAELKVGSYLAAPVMRGGVAVAAVFLSDDRPKRWSPADVSLAREAADRTWAAIDRAAAKRRVADSERRFAAIFGQAAIGLAELGADGRYARVNDSMARLLGRPAAEVTGLPITETTHAEDAAEEARLFAQAAAGEPYAIERRIVRPDGSSLWAVSNVTRLVDEGGAPAGFFAVTADVSERREQERLRSLLLAELNHRVKNNLSTVQALARQTRLTTASPEAFDAAFDARLMALSRAHDLLMRETWTATPLLDLVAGALEPYAFGSGDRVSIDGPDVRLSPTAAVTLGMAFHELATNAAKFGALSRPDGRVAIVWSPAAADALAVEWRETGGPEVSPPLRRGFGLRLIERAAPAELGGRASLAFLPSGVTCAFHLPLSQKIMMP